MVSDCRRTFGPASSIASMGKRASFLLAPGLTFDFSPGAIVGACKDEGIQEVNREGGKELAGIESYPNAEFLFPGRSAVSMASKKAELSAKAEVRRWLSYLKGQAAIESGRPKKFVQK